MRCKLCCNWLILQYILCEGILHLINIKWMQIIRRKLWMLPTINFTTFVDLYKFHPSICCLLRMCNVNVTYFYNLCIYLNTSNNNKNFQVAGITIGLTAASLLYATFRAGSNPNVTDFQIDSLVNDLTRDQTAAQNIISSLAYVSRQTSYIFWHF